MGRGAVQRGPPGSGQSRGRPDKLLTPHIITVVVKKIHSNREKSGGSNTAQGPAWAHRRGRRGLRRPEGLRVGAAAVVAGEQQPGGHRSGEGGQEPGEAREAAVCRGPSTLCSQPPSYSVTKVHNPPSVSDPRGRFWDADFGPLCCFIWV